jgi:hypothetical protein
MQEAELTFLRFAFARIMTAEEILTRTPLKGNALSSVRACINKLPVPILDFLYY